MTPAVCFRITPLFFFLSVSLPAAQPAAQDAYQVASPEGAAFCYTIPRQGGLNDVVIQTEKSRIDRYPVNAAAAGTRTPAKNVLFRGSLANARIRFEKGGAGHVAFLGGSITEMNGYRPLVCELLKRRFPKTAFTFTNAGIASTCSTTGACRLSADVLSAGPVDLLFVEFAVNDDQDAGHARRECVRGMEGIVRQLRRHNPAADVVVTYFVNPGMVETIHQGGVPLPIRSHEEVTRHYAISSINLAQEVAERIKAGTLTWKQFGGTHPAPYGNAICADMIEKLLDHAWAAPLSAEPKMRAHPLPTEPLDPGAYERGRFIDPKLAAVKRGWTLGVPPWKKLAGSSRSRFTSLPMLCADRPGAELTLEFTGTAVGAYVVAGPDAGTVEVRVDDGPATLVNLFHRYSAGLHYPRTVLFATDLKPGPHRLHLRVAEKTASKGHAVRFMQFVAN